MQSRVTPAHLLSRRLLRLLKCIDAQEQVGVHALEYHPLVQVQTRVGGDPVQQLPHFPHERYAVIHPDKQHRVT